MFCLLPCYYCAVKSSATPTSKKRSFDIIDIFRYYFFAGYNQTEEIYTGQTDK